LLLELLKDEPPGQGSYNPRRGIVAALGQCDEFDERVYPVFLEMALNDEDDLVRADAVKWLGQHAAQHQNDERLIETLIAALDDWHARHEVAWALVVVGSEAVPYLNRRIFSDPTVLSSEITCPDPLSTSVRWAISSLLQIWPYEHIDPVYSPANTIAKLGPLAVRSLLPIHSDQLIRDTRRHALRQLGEDALPTLRCMIEGGSLSELLDALDGVRFLAHPELGLDPAVLNSLLPALEAIDLETVRSGSRTYVREAMHHVISEIRNRSETRN